MKEDHRSQGIPPHEEGAAINAQNSTAFPTQGEAINFYKTVRNRVLDVNHWQQLAGAAMASFQLVDKSGIPTKRLAEQGDYFRINVPGPGPSAGKGYDWVQIEEIKEQNEPEAQSISMRVRPTQDPFSKSNDVAHFFDEQSTSTFKAIREGDKITASIHDRNAKPNTDVHNTADKIRNAAVGTGAIAGFSKLQWQLLVDGLLKGDDDAE